MTLIGILLCIAGNDTVNQAREFHKYVKFHGSILTKSDAAAIVLESFDGHTKKFVKDGVKILPCLNQTKDIQCVDCRICFETEPLLRTKTVIGFLAHGTSKNKVVAKLQKLNIKPKINRTIQLV